MVRKRLANQKGMALILTLLVAEVLLVLGGVFILRTFSEAKAVNSEQKLTQSFYLAQAGADASLKDLDNLINNFMLTTIGATNPSTVISSAQSYVAAQNGLGFLVATVKDNGTPKLTMGSGEATYSGGTTTLGNGSYQTNISITQKANPSSVGTDQWDFPFYYRLQSVGQVGGFSRKIALVGDFTVRVQRDNFAKYALFTNQQSMPNGTAVWFTNKTNFTGPVFTNDRFNFALNPSGSFTGVASQKQQTARFYNNNNPVLLDANANGTRDVPTFNAGFTRAAAAITLSSSTDQTTMMNQATGGGTYGSNGIYVPNSGGHLTGGIYVRGNASVSLSVDGSDRAVYTVSQGSTTKTITVDRSANQTTVHTSGGSTDTYGGLPNGTDGVGTLVFVNGSLSNLHGTVQRDTGLTIASTSDMSIDNNLVYSNYTPAQGTPGQTGYVPPSAEGADNILGLVSWGGNVRISTSAPDDVNIHGTVLAQNGILQVDNYDDQGAGTRGTATLLGGMITNNYGAFGQFSSVTGLPVSGYGRNFVYDDRMRTGSSPPYFPSLRTFIAFTNDITDKITLQEGGF